MELPPDSVIEERLVKTFPNTRLRELALAEPEVIDDDAETDAGSADEKQAPDS